MSKIKDIEHPSKVRGHWRELNAQSDRYRYKKKGRLKYRKGFWRKLRGR